MKTLKTVAVLIFTVALFFSCAQEDIGDYGTLVINLSGGSSRSVTAEVDPLLNNIKGDLTYIFECINEKTGTTTTAGPYEVGVPKDAYIQLIPGDWVVRVKVRQKIYQGSDLKGEEVIGSAQYRPVTIKAGQTVILGGISVPTSPYGVAIARSAPEGFTYNKLNDWLEIPTTILINRYLQVGADGQPGSHNPTTINPYDHLPPYGTANILWDDDGENYYLYVCVFVKDADLSATNGTEHDSNSVEIFFNEDGTGHQYRITPGSSHYYGYYPKDVPEESNGSYKKDEPIPSGVELSSETTGLPSGVSYAVIAKIPILSKKHVIGVDLQINGIQTGKTKRSSIAVWLNGQVYARPSVYKEDLTLVD